MQISRSVFIIAKSPGINDVGACGINGFDEGTSVGNKLGVVIGNRDSESLGFMVGDELELGTLLGQTDGLIEVTIKGTIEGTIKENTACATEDGLTVSSIPLSSCLCLSEARDKYQDCRCCNNSLTTFGDGSGSVSCSFTSLS